MKIQNTMFGRILGLALILLTVAAVSRPQGDNWGHTWVGDFSNMTVGAVRPIYAVAYGGSWNFPDHLVVGDCNGEETSCWDQSHGLGFSLSASGPFSHKLQNVPLPLDYWGNGTSQTIYMKALAPTPAVHVVSCSASVSCATTTNLSISGTPPPPPPNPNPPPTVTAVGVGEIVPYWLVTPSPVAQAYRNMTIHFTLQPNDWVGVGLDMNSATWGAARGVDMYIDSAGNGKTQIFYVKGRKRTTGPASFSASSDNHFAVASQSKSVTVVQVSQITWVQYDGDHPIDTNPGVGGGKRHFADKDYPGETNDNNWRLVGIKAQVSPAISGMTVRVKTFDVDDPSNHSWIDPNGGQSNDNREVTYGLTGNIITDSSGAGTIYYRVSSRPGDNYRVAATVSSQPLTASQPLRQKFDSVITDSLNGMMLYGSGIIPEYNPSTPFQSHEQVVASPMLTIWRRLHIERDSLGPVVHNAVTGSFLRTQRFTTGVTTFDLDASAPPLPAKAYENGRLVFRETHSAPPVSYVVVSNTTSSVTVEGTHSGFNFSSDTFALYDDDDFNGDDGANLDGDIGENIGWPPTGLLQDSDNPSQNVLAPAYIRPKYDLSGEQPDLPFAPKMESSTDNFHHDYLADDADFWTIYILNAYQTNAVRNACDPDVYGCGLGMFAEPNGITFFEEDYADAYRQRVAAGNPPGSFVTRNRIVATMVGFLLGATGADGALMAGADSCTTRCLEFHETSLNTFRNILHP